MNIAGFAKNSFVDYPGQMACVVFAPYCNMKCWYCHNKHILGKETRVMDESVVTDHLEKRKDLLGAVVVTGGEPTMQPDLIHFLRRLKQRGLAVKLDTNGTNPAVLQALTRERLLDYVAMDFKAPPDKYYETAGVPVDINAVTASLNILRQSGVRYELRTTFAPTLTREDILRLGAFIGPVAAYYLQQYRPVTHEDPPAHDSDYVRDTAEKMRALIGVCETRGL